MGGLPSLLKGGGSGVLWFGHGANLPSLLRAADDLADVDLTVCTNVRKDGFVPWSQDAEARCLAACEVVLVTGDNPGASSNRIVKALRAGKYVVTDGSAPAWEQSSRMVRTQPGCMGLAPRPDSPPTITQSMPAR